MPALEKKEIQKSIIKILTQMPEILTEISIQKNRK